MKEIEKLEKLMVKHNISRETLAREIGVSYFTLYRWLHNHHKPSFIARRKIAEYLKKVETEARP